VKYGTFRYQFRFNTSLKLVYFLPRDTESNCNIYFRDNLGTMLELVGSAESFMDDEKFTSYLHQTFEKINPVMTVQNSKWKSFGLAFASPFYDWDESPDPNALYGSRLFKYPLSCKFGFNLGITENGQIACLKLPKSYRDCYKDVKGKCADCNSGFFLRNNDCHWCPDTCTRCDAGQCYECKDDYVVMHNGKCEKCDDDTIFDSSARRCIPKINPKRDESKGGAVTGAMATALDKSGRKIGKDKSLDKGDPNAKDQQDFLYGGFDLVTDKPPVPVMIEIMVKQQVRRLNSKNKSKRKRRKLEEESSDSTDASTTDSKVDDTQDRQLRRRKRKSKGKSSSPADKGATKIVKPVDPQDYTSTEEKGVTTWRTNITFKAALWPNSKFDIKIKANAQDAKMSKHYKIEGLKYSILKHNTNPEEAAPKVDQKFLPDEVQVQQKNATESEEAKGIMKLDGLSLNDLEGIIKRLTMVQTLDKKARKQLVDLNLNLEPGIQRCEAINGAGQCVPLWGAFAAKRCMRGYKRYFF
jgi:hypothetical protein